MPSHARQLQEATGRGALVAAAFRAPIHLVREKESCALLRYTGTATAVTPLATSFSNQSLSPSTRVSTPPEMPTPSFWGWEVLRTADAAVRARALVKALVSKSSALTGRASGSSSSAKFRLFLKCNKLSLSHKKTFPCCFLAGFCYHPSNPGSTVASHLNRTLRCR